MATCGSVHVCPVCMRSVRRVRAAELSRAGDAWESVQLPDEDENGKARKGKARGLVLVTLTMRHYARQSLSLLAQRQREAWKLAFGQNALKSTKQIKKGLGVVGYVRAWETTHGANGWHAHYHVAVFLDERPDARRVRYLERLIYRAWANALERVGAYRPSQAHGVRVDAPAAGDAGQIAQYLMKNQDGKWSAAQEMVRADVKAGRRGHRMPLEIARGAVDGDADDVELWREYEETATGLRALYWSNGLRKRLAELVELDDRQDAEVAADEEAGPDKKPAAHFPLRTWYGHIVKVPGRRLQLVHAAEKWGGSGIRSVVEGWGLLWNIDVTEPEQLPQAAVPTAAEVLRGMERATMQERAEVWRREFDRQEREERRARLEQSSKRRGDQTAIPEVHRAVDRRRQEEQETAQERHQAYRKALRVAKGHRPAGELHSGMQRFRASV